MCDVFVDMLLIKVCNNFFEMCVVLKMAFFQKQEVYEWLCNRAMICFCLVLFYKRWNRTLLDEYVFFIYIS